MNRSDLRGEVRRLLQDPETVNGRSVTPRWSDSIINERLDQAQERISSLTRCIVASSGLYDITAGTAEYSLPSDFIGDKEVQYKNRGGKWQYIKKTTERELDLQNVEWRELTGYPEYYYLRGNVMGFVPEPDTSETSAMKMDYYKTSTDFSSDTVTPFDGLYELVPFHRLVAQDAARMCMMDDQTKEKQVIMLERDIQRGIKDLRNVVNENKGGETRIINFYENFRQKSRRA